MLLWNLIYTLSLSFIRARTLTCTHPLQNALLVFCDNVVMSEGGCLFLRLKQVSVSVLSAKSGQKVTGKVKCLYFLVNSTAQMLNSEIRVSVCVCTKNYFELGF